MAVIPFFLNTYLDRLYDVDFFFNKKTNLQKYHVIFPNSEKPKIVLLNNTPHVEPSIFKSLLDRRIRLAKKIINIPNLHEPSFRQVIQRISQSINALLMHEYRISTRFGKSMELKKQNKIQKKMTDFFKKKATEFISGSSEEEENYEFKQSTITETFMPSKDNFDYDLPVKGNEDMLKEKIMLTESEKKLVLEFKTLALAYNKLKNINEYNRSSNANYARPFEKIQLQIKRLNWYFNRISFLKIFVTSETFNFNPVICQTHVNDFTNCNFKTVCVRQTLDATYDDFFTYINQPIVFNDDLDIFIDDQYEDIVFDFETWFFEQFLRFIRK